MIWKIIMICMFMSKAYGGVKQYEEEARKYVGESSKPELSAKIQGLPNFTANPKEANLSAGQLRIKADDKVKGIGALEDFENQALRAARGSYENPHRSQHTVAKMKNKSFIQKSEAISRNPISGLNAEAKTGCKVADKNVHGENVKFEEYLVDVEDTEIKQEKQTCEEDEDKLFYCTRTLKSIDCDSKYACAFGSSDTEGGLFTTSSNNELMQISGGLRLKYTGTTLELGNDRHWTYDVGENGCVMKEFTAKFFIKDLQSVSRFVLTEVFENNLMHVEINGHVAYNGLGGTDLFLNGWTVHAPNGRPGGCLTNAGHTTWKSTHFDALANNALKEGENNLKIKLIVHWYGHAGVKIDAKQYCCGNWSDQWESDCPV